MINKPEIDPYNNDKNQMLLVIFQKNIIATLNPLLGQREKERACVFVCERERERERERPGCRRRACQAPPQPRTRQSHTVPDKRSGKKQNKQSQACQARPRRRSIIKKQKSGPLPRHLLDCWTLLQSIENAFYREHIQQTSTDCWTLLQSIENTFYREHIQQTSTRLLDTTY